MYLPNRFFTSGERHSHTLRGSFSFTSSQGSLLKLKNHGKPLYLSKDLGVYLYECISSGVMIREIQTV